LGFDPNTLKIFDLEDGGATLMETGNASDVFADLRRKNASAAKKEGAETDSAPSSVQATKTIKDLTTLTSLIRR